METITSSATIVSSPSYLPIFSPKSKDPSSISRRILRFSISPKNNGNESELRSDSNDSSLVPILSNRTLSKDAAMGLVLSAANVRGWTTGSGMEGPPVPAGSESESSTEKISTFPWSLFTKSPRRRMRVAFTCNVCGQRTTRAINPHAYTDGTVFVQATSSFFRQPAGFAPDHELSLAELAALDMCHNRAIFKPMTGDERLELKQKCGGSWKLVLRFFLVGEAGSRREKSQAIAGPGHSIAVTSKVVVYSFGSNNSGQLGHGTIEEDWRPRQIRSSKYPTAGRISETYICGEYIMLEFNSTQFSKAAKSTLCMQKMRAETGITL